MKKYLLFAVASLALMCSCHHDTIEDRAEREAKDYTEKFCPTPYTNDVRTDSLTFDKSSKTFTYYCRLRGLIDNPKVIAENETKLKTAIRENFSNDTGTKIYKDAKFNFIYILRSDNDPKTILLKVKLTEKDYK
ncbi:MAG: hypothetical protein IJS06_03960 [Prevotella sp.]|jgi:hypothetical protein|nr:hypothetical protein [Prevotella sp.]